MYHFNAFFGRDLDSKKKMLDEFRGIGLTSQFNLAPM